jgi:hypothetical protein
MTNDGANGSGDAGGGEELGGGLLARVRESYNPPPEPPLDAMWGRIEADRLGTPGGAEDRTRKIKRGRTSWWLAMTAGLVVGVALGRVSSAAETGGSIAPHTMLSIAKPEERGGDARPAAQPGPCEAPSARAAQ